jgi:hypothetical protein
LRYAALLAMSAPAMLGQVPTGTVTGYVHNTTDNAMVGAKVNTRCRADARNLEFTLPLLGLGL